MAFINRYTMTDIELIELINDLSEEKITSIESITNPNEEQTVVVGLSGVKLIEFILTTAGDFSYKFIGTKLRNLK